MTGQLSLVIREATALGQVFAAAVAGRVGLSASDLDYLDVVMLRGRMTAGELAAATGLTTGAVTGIIDRLERAGFVARERDPEDRRRVFVVPREERIGGAMQHYESLATAMNRLADSFSEAELALLLDYFSRSRDVMRDEIAKLAAPEAEAVVRSPRPEGASAPRRRAPQPPKSSSA